MDIYQETLKEIRKYCESEFDDLAAQIQGGDFSPDSVMYLTGKKEAFGSILGMFNLALRAGNVKTVWDTLPVVEINLPDGDVVTHAQIAEQIKELYSAFPGDDKKDLNDFDIFLVMCATVLFFYCTDIDYADFESNILIEVAKEIKRSADVEADGDLNKLVEEILGGV